MFMNSIQATQLSSSISNAESINQSKPSSSTQKNEFLELMVAQLKNQNPLDPQNGGEFLSQLAQFSSVDGIERLNTTLGDISGSFRSGQVLQATALVGRSVQIESNHLNYNSAPISGDIELTKPSSNVSLTMTNGSGDVVKEFSLGSAPEGNLTFQWDGLNSQGQSSAPGQYTVSAISRGEDGKPIPLKTLFNTNVNSVTVGQDNQVTLNLASQDPVSLDQVKRIY